MTFRTLEYVVPYESPKNHTVVQAGKFQPYREITKPFEMSDFYKYSTKFRKTQTHVLQNGNDHQVQHKGIYKPLQPLECQPLLPNSFHETQTHKAASDLNASQTEKYSSELLSWYHDKNGTTKQRSSTLV